MKHKRRRIRRTLKHIVPRFRWLSLEPQSARDHVNNVLTSWLNTPYAVGQQTKGSGVDCVRFVCAVLDELQGRDFREIPKLPPDASLHDRASSFRVMRMILEKYQPLENITNGTLEPGDALVLGPPNGGPGHAMFAGVVPNTLYHATPAGVHQCGLTFSAAYCKLFRIFRCQQKDQWSPDGFGNTY